MRRLQLVVLLSFGIGFAIAGSVYSQTLFEQMIMPGELAEAHAEFENTCDSCHVAFSKDDQRQLCLQCHKEIAADTSSQSGFHGRDTDAATTDCKSCHTDHIGRSADIVRFDTETFDHDLTDFALLGAHQNAECNGCHEKNKAYRDTPSLCIACHQSDDRHKGGLGKNCQSCHNETGWQQTLPFDHGRTSFPLLGSHDKVTCSGCHFGEVYKGVPTACTDCHQAQDIHEGRNGSSCERCHSPEKWSAIKFDHDRDTKFPLRGKHKTQQCGDCHRSNVYEKLPATKCIDCHSNDDAHKGQLGTGCKQCHNENGWRSEVSFDHDITRFPLLGLHAAAPCEACHTTARFKQAPETCVECHRKDDTHDGRLGSDCSFCHTANGWAFWNFDHDRQTDFSLTGAHAGLDCLACHTQRAPKKSTVPSSCHSCHRRDDIHRGSFGRRCARCHTTETFSRLRFQQ